MAKTIKKPSIAPFIDIKIYIGIPDIKNKKHTVIIVVKYKP
jgi:hypothetical protein